MNGNGSQARDEREAEILLDTIARHAARLGAAGVAPLRRMRVSSGDATVDVEWQQPEGAPTATVVAVPTTTSVVTAAAEPLPDTFTLGAPAVGTFYRAPEPGAPPFVEVGDVVSAGQQIGIIEAMKLMNPIEAERPGRVVEIVASDASPVEYGQPILVLAPVQNPADA
ncbi:acetyl-CoA carboxylase biotin carboxyl carrier protein subunit [Asanoa sp. WMMD1127]|uniref:acetyl-CoA carboxylase biotin carboxyl carrier protein n=1 Tax=Asanoa sp. WMMD1127 TaxID=3016107 RepID=UPI002416527A|nr:biotin/lipoyl-containing protein [Asanoa sp. WMMD1127]MDG4820790.1 acetyl-CoA carboxylase biotin carboxyl carrier protein subunit [Asanoa sp. WMMD1127]